MTIAEWLSTLTPAPPARLMERMVQLLGRRGSEPAAETPRVLIHAARDTVERLLRERRFSRDGALDLLVADAFMTYAFEHAAATDQEDLDALALGAARTVGQLVAVHG